MKIFVTDTDGKKHELEATKDWSLMEIIREGGLPIQAQCGGSCACATCHVYVDPAWIDKLPASTEEEEGMLDGAPGVEARSRLSCQIVFDESLDGIHLILAPGSV
ncbi:MAG: 2Fe-2S iron-sulfur cluster binding domain-containing protein [Alphaproteobacteria bacterium]|nr:MAG: 2Fe-2S iron-sulfur cluster binding domain-containing protein [Alphaproteobacteria bacterium]